VDDLTKEFLVESYENLDRMDRDFVELEKNPSKEILASIFRAIHTIKGTCGFLGYLRLERVAHAGENLLSLLRDGALQVNQPMTDALLAMVDAVREILECIETTGGEGERDDSALIETLNALQKGQTAESSLYLEPSTIESRSPSTPQPETAQASRPIRLTLDDIDRALELQAKGDTRLLGEILVQEGQARAEDIDRALKQQAKGDSRRLGDILVDPNKEAAGEASQTLQSQNQARPAVSDSTIRVDVAILDKLMNLVGELVLSRNQIMQFAAGQEDSTFLATSQHLSLVTSELQEGVMKTRMQPIGNVWSKFPRMVRDLAASCKKQVRIEMEGTETELDRTIIEALKDPLTHAVRNAVDHGIENPEARHAAGKAAEGRVLLRAFHEGGQVNIEIIDDGDGVNAAKVRAKALHRGLITAEQGARLSERELVNLIFLPGFSTAEKITNVSGRGVGMDVLKTNIEKIRGTVDIQSKPGQGTTLKIKIPLTLAIIPALMVTAGGDRYAIPQASLIELVRLEGEQARKGVEMVHGAPVYRLRDDLLPLIYLNRVLKLSNANDAADATVNIVVLQADGRSFGLVVDAINDSKDIVVKPLGRHLQGLRAFSGATILGDGSVALILDIIGISQCANFVAENRERPHVDAAAPAQKSTGERQALLVCRYGALGRAAIPVGLVARLEEFSMSEVEKSCGDEVVQYRGEIMPLIRLSQVLGENTGESEKKANIQVVVHRGRGRSIGLVVEQIADIVEERVRVISRDENGYFTGSAIVQGKVTDILDVRAVIESVNPSYLKQPDAA
jgi:two-component system chemotaxis sensor kinase CheA